MYGKILSFCPLNWRTADDAAQPVLQAAIDTCFFPLYEVEHGHTTLTYDPDATDRRHPVADWLKLMGKTPPSLTGRRTEQIARRESKPKSTAAGSGSRRCTSTRFSDGAPPDTHPREARRSPRSPSSSSSTRRSSPRRRSAGAVRHAPRAREAASASRSPSPTTIASRGTITIVVQEVGAPRAASARSRRATRFSMSPGRSAGRSTFPPAATSAAWAAASASARCSA